MPAKKLSEKQGERNRTYEASCEIYHIVVYPGITRDQTCLVPVAVFFSFGDLAASRAFILRLEAAADNAVGEATYSSAESPCPL